MDKSNPAFEKHGLIETSMKAHAVPAQLAAINSRRGTREFMADYIEKCAVLAYRLNYTGDECVEIGKLLADSKIHEASKKVFNLTKEALWAFGSDNRTAQNLLREIEKLERSTGVTRSAPQPNHKLTVVK